MDIKAYKPAVRELASRIYQDMVARAATISDQGVKMTASAENLARLSFRLADAFQAVEDDLNVDNIPKTGFNLDAVDLSSWSK